MAAKVAFFVLLAISLASADLYMHNPRGSNNRVDENNANAPANRMFDSQNNNEAGYNRGEADDHMVYYEGSYLMVQWTAQHACGVNPNTHCEIVMQYMCDDNIRNGDSTNRPNDNLGDNADAEPNADRGRHEPYANWLECKQRERNGGLFVADQDPGDTAASTRQNAGANRSGYECAEERDYYPYWHPSPWKDVAILTDNITRCAYYQQESQNVMAKGHCTEVTENNEADCEAAGGNWQMAEPHNLDAPECALAPWIRDNVHGNGITPNPEGEEQTWELAHYNWTIPAAAGEGNCIMRLRYNVSSDDYDGWNTDASSNGANSPVENDPEVDLGGALDTALQLNINTAQFGRTFEDRTHVFEVKARPNGVEADASIFNINVRGRRGNNNDAYPSVEYDYVPSLVHMAPGNFIHMQWSGSNNNNNGNDRHNVVQIDELGDSYPLYLEDANMWENEEQGVKAATSCGSNDANLQDVNPYCNVGLIQMSEEGEYHFMSTKNNAYTNRTQKGTVIVDDGDGVFGGSISTGAAVGIAGAGIAVLGGGAVAAVVYKKKFAGGSARF